MSYHHGGSDHQSVQLRVLLSRVDGSAPSIHAAAGAMMKHYDRSADVAVVEWRNSLHNAPVDKHLALLYVANEVLQNSKRNRGNKFLEAFSPVLGQSLIFICQQQLRNGGGVASVEKIRRTVKIWGDRRVFSLRFVTELLKGLEPYRSGGGGSIGGAGSSSGSVGGGGGGAHSSSSHSHHSSSHHHSSSSSSSHYLSSPTRPTFSPEEEEPKEDNEQQQNKDDDSDDDDPMQMLLNNDKENSSDDGNNDDDSDDDDDNMFGNSSESKLKVDIPSFDTNTNSNDANAAISAAGGGTTASSSSKGGGAKRRRSSLGSTTSVGSGEGTSSKRRRSSNKVKILSTNSLMDLWKNVSELQLNYDTTQSGLKEIKAWLNDINHNTTILESLVGDDLLDTFQQVTKYQDRLKQQRKSLHRIATERKSLQNEAMKYLPWLENALKQDQEDIKFCNTIMKQIVSFQYIHGEMKAARDKKLQEEINHQRLQEELMQKKKEEEESKKFRELALKSETEAKKGMVWNPNTREYQYLNTDESWRD